MSISRIMLAKFGAIVPAADVNACIVIPSLLRRQKIVRQFSLQGIQYEESLAVSLSLRIFIDGATPNILTSLGYDVQEVRTVYNAVEIEVAKAENAARIAAATEEQEEEAPRVRGVKRARRVTAAPEVELVEVPAEQFSSRYYVEYVLTEIEVDETNVLPIVDHPTFIEACDANKDNAGKLMKRLNSYIASIKVIQSDLNFQGEEDINEDDDTFNVGPRLTNDGRTAQMEAHNVEQEAARAYIDRQWNFFEQRFLGEETYETLSIDEVGARYGSLVDEQGKMFSTSRYLEYIAADVIDIEFGADKD